MYMYLDDCVVAADYHPIFTRVDQWAVGAQYFFAVNNHSAANNWTGKAATGELIQ